MRGAERWWLSAGVVLLVAGASWVVGAKKNAREEDVPVVSAATVPSGPLMVTLKLAKSKVEAGEWFAAKFRVTNVSNATQTLSVWLCSYDVHWELDNALVSILPIGCDKNYPITKTLGPGENYDVRMGLAVNEGAPAGPLTFRAGFTAMDTTTTVWSGAVTIEVTGVRAKPGFAKKPDWKGLWE